MRLPNTFLMANPQTQTSSPRRCNQLGLMNGISQNAIWPSIASMNACAHSTKY